MRTSRPRSDLSGFGGRQRFSQKSKVIDRQTGNRKRGKQDKTDGITSGRVLDQPELERREKSAEPAERADESRHRAGFFCKILRHELENRAVSQAQSRRAAKRADRERRHRRKTQKHRKSGNRDKNENQNLRAANLIRQRAADGTHEGCEHHETGGSRARVGRRQIKDFAQKRRHIKRQRDKSAESQKIKQRENPRQTRAFQNAQAFRQTFSLCNV